jgi:hypothetical protein
MKGAFLKSRFNLGYKRIFKLKRVVHPCTSLQSARQVPSPLIYRIEIMKL